MSEDLQTRVRQAAPEPTIDLDERQLVRKAIRQRKIRRAGAITAGLVAMVAVAVLVAGQMLTNTPDVEIVGPGDDPAGTAEALTPPPPEPEPSPAVDLQALFADLPRPQVPEGSGLAGGGTRVQGRGVLIAPGGPLHLNVPDPAHDADGTLTFTVWQVDDDGNRMEQIRTAEANAGPQGANAILVDVSTDEGAKYEVLGELRQIDGNTAVWRDWAVVAPQIASASLEVSDTTVASDQEFQVAIRNLGTVMLTYGLFYDLYRWDGETWIAQQGTGEGFKAIGLTVPPARLGDPQTVTAPSETGYYRIVKKVHTEPGKQIEVAAQFRVAAEGSQRSEQPTSDGRPGRNTTLELLGKWEGGPPRGSAHLSVAWIDDAVELADLWQTFRLNEPPPALLEGDAVLLVATGESGSCPEQVTDVVVKAGRIELELTEGPAVHPVPSDYGCTADFNPVTFAIQVDSGLLEPTPIVSIGDTAVRLGQEGEIVSAQYGERPPASSS